MKNERSECTWEGEFVVARVVESSNLILKLDMVKAVER